MINTDRGTAEAYGRDGTGIAGNGTRQLLSFQEQNQNVCSILNSELSGLLNLLPDTEELLSQIEQLKNRIEQLENENQQWQKLTQKLNNENQLITETEQRIADLKQQIENARDIDERMRKLRERRAGGRTSADDGTDAGRTGSERRDDYGTEQAAQADC